VLCTQTPHESLLELLDELWIADNTSIQLTELLCRLCQAQLCPSNCSLQLQELYHPKQFGELIIYCRGRHRMEDYFVLRILTLSVATYAFKTNSSVFKAAHLDLVASGILACAAVQIPNLQDIPEISFPACYE
jgi:hypothetical protein